MKKKKFFLYLGMILSLITVFYCLGNISLWIKDQIKTKELNKRLKTESFLKEESLKKEEILVNPPNDQEDSYWNYINIDFLQVNFSNLKKQNADTVGWIQVRGTKIDYPIVQTTDNSFYLSHSFDKTNNKAGWIFSDYRNKWDELNLNTIIYGHARLDDTMFGSLKMVLEESWYQNLQNHIIQLSTPQENMIWQIFSIYTIPKESYYITSYFSNYSDYQTFIHTMINRSKYSFHTRVNTKDKILTLSTCKDNYGNRIVVHAKLIKKETLSF